jgi:hypothetical protein
LHQRNWRERPYHRRLLHLMARSAAAHRKPVSFSNSTARRQAILRPPTSVAWLASRSVGHSGCRIRTRDSALARDPCPQVGQFLPLALELPRSTGSCCWSCSRLWRAVTAICAGCVACASMPQSRMPASSSAAHRAAISPSVVPIARRSASGRYSAATMASCRSARACCACPAWPRSALRALLLIR